MTDRKSYQPLGSRIERARLVLRLVLAVAFVIAGALHLATPRPFLAITPSWVPYPALVIAVTGVCELAGAVGLLIPRLRRLAGIMLALYCVCVFPANVHHALAYVAVGKAAPLGWWYHGPRLAFQPVFVWWCLFAGRVIDWPFRRHALA